MRHQKKIFQFMQTSDFYPHPVSKIEHRETHISKVFLTGGYVEYVAEISENRKTGARALVSVRENILTDFQF